MHAFDVLGDPVRRRILELLADGERSSGAITEVVRSEYAVDAEPLRDIDAWLDRFRAFWAPHLDALATEIARGRRQRRRTTDDRSSP